MLVSDKKMMVNIQARHLFAVKVISFKHDDLLYLYEIGLTRHQGASTGIILLTPCKVDIII